ncbi:MAG TPA: PaREP1 family protein, partial [Sulfolobales archaeon]|nr:PaREP1 family protein [Sulfolobales archaeon]
MSSQNITIPERIVKKAKELGIDITDIVIETLAEKLGIDPVEELEARTELAKKYLEEGIRLTDSNPVQASEKLYKAAEEAVKAAAKILNLPVISNVKERGRWTAT